MVIVMLLLFETANQENRVQMLVNRRGLSELFFVQIADAQKSGGGAPISAEFRHFHLFVEWKSPESTLGGKISAVGFRWH